MKKLILLASVMMLSVGAFAQSKHRVGSLTVQPKIGLNIADVTDADNSDPRIGFVGGAEFEYQVTPMFSLSAGALYSVQGAKADGTVGGVKVKETLKLDYINVPIVANVYVAPGFAVKLGIQPGFNVNAEIEGKAKRVTETADISDVVKSMDFTIPVGLSYEYNNFVFDGRYNWGVSKIIDGEGSKNSVFQFTVGYKFSL